jgi:hypothetical protein
MKSKILLAALIAFGLAGQRAPAKADVSYFEASGSYTGVAPVTDGTFSGTISIDVTIGKVLAIDLHALGHDFTFIGQSENVLGGWRIDAVAVNFGDFALVFTVTTNPHTLVGFGGGDIIGCCIVDETTATATFLANACPAPLQPSPVLSLARVFPD